MAKQYFENNVSATLVRNASSTDTVLYFDDVFMFPNVTSGDFFLLTIFSAASLGVESNWEVVKVTSVNYSDKSVTCQRGYEIGASAHVAGELAQMRTTARTLNVLRDGIGKIYSDLSSSDPDKGAALIGIGNGKMLDVVFKKRFFAEIYPSLQAAVDAASANGGGIVDIHDLWTISAPLTLPSNVLLQGWGKAEIDYRSITKVYDVNGRGTYDIHAVEAIGSVGSSISLSADAVEKTSSITVADASGFSVDDWVQLGDSSLYPYSGTFTVPRGEIKKIRSISGNTLNFTTVIYENYATADSAFVRKVNFVENVGVRNIKFTGSNANQLVNWNREIPIWFEYVKDFWVEGNRLNGQDFIGVGLQSSIIGNVHDNHITGAFRISSASLGSVYYGVALRNNCQWVDVSGNIGETLRRLVVNTSSQSTYGQPYFCNVRGNIMRDSHSNSSGRVHAFEHHGFGRWISYIGNMSDSCLGGINIEGRDLLIADNHFANCSGFGVQFDGEGKVFENIVVRGNTITRSLVDGFTPSGAGVYVIEPGTGGSGSAAILRNVLIENNTISGWTTNSRQGIRIDDVTGILADNCVVRGNNIDSLLSGSIDGTSRGILCSAPGWEFYDNKIHNYYRHIDLQPGANGCRALDNKLINSSLFGVSSEAAIVIGSNGNVVADNYVENFASGIRFAAGTETGNKCYRNIFENVTTQFAGTLPNDVILKGNLPSVQYTTSFAIAADAITIRDTDQTLIVVDTEASAATDDLSTITFSGPTGRTIVLKTGSSARDVTVKDNVGNIQLAGGDFIMDTSSDSLTLLWTGTQWVELARANNA